MEPRRFDAFTKSLAKTSSRRTLVRGFLAGIAGSGIALAGRNRASAACCTGYGAVAPRSRGGNATACCSPPQVCYSRNGRVLQCGTKFRAEGGKAGCCVPGDIACQNAILNYPAPPAGCVVVP